MSTRAVQLSKEDLEKARAMLSKLKDFIYQADQEAKTNPNKDELVDVEHTLIIEKF